MVVGSYIKNKLEEYEYFLQKVIDLCDLVYRNFRSGINPVNTSDENINYTFNAFVNTFQSLKDSFETATTRKIPWSNFSTARHSIFIKGCRNAITHDGMQIINAYADGKYYVANNIERFDNYGKFVKLESPKQDILSLCLEFSIDLMKIIEEITDEYGLHIPIQSKENKLEYIEKCFDNPFIPEFAKDLFQQNREMIVEQLSTVTFDPVLDIKKQTAQITELCNTHITKNCS